MAEITNVRVYGLEESMVASSYPMKDEIDGDFDNLVNSVYEPSEKGSRYDRAKKLAQTPIGSGHGQWLAGIVVQFDLTFSLKAWPEFQRYHFADFVSSCSTMHKIKSMDIKNCCNKYVDKIIMQQLAWYQFVYNENPTEENFYRLIYNIPSGFELTARITTNYLQLKTMYKQRRNHKLKPDWGVFCDWIESLPHSELITG